MTSEAPVGLIFVPLSVEHFPLLHTWLNSSHVLEFWGKEFSIEDVHAKYLEKMNSKWQNAYIVALGDRPFGYIQNYRASLVGAGWWPKEPASTVGIDQFIGDTNFLSRGLGTLMVRQFTDCLLENPDIERVIADPTPHNLRAISCYRKAGFSEVGAVNTPDGQALLMERRKAGF